MRWAVAGVKDDMIRSGESLAEALGISPEELEKLDYDICPEASDEGLIYCYRIEFSDECPLYILEKIQNLEDENIVRVAPGVFDYDHYDYEEQFEAVSDNKSPFENFFEEIANLNRLIDLQVGIDIQGILYRQIFISIIGLMETFLSDMFINQTMNEDSYLKIL